MMGLVGTSHILSSRLLQTPTTCRHAVPLLRAALSLRHETLRSMSSDGSSKAPATPSSSRLRGTTCMVTGGASGIGFAIAQRFLREGAGKIILVGRRKERLTDALDRLRGEHAGISQETYERGHGDDADAKYSAAQGMSDETSSDDGSWTGERTLSSVKTQDSSRHGSEGSHRSDSDRLALIAGDVGDSSFWSDDVKKAMDSVDILINAAGVSRSALLPLAKDEHIDQVLKTNLQGTIFACRAMARRALRKQRGQPHPEDSSSSSSSKCIINISSLHATKGGIGASTYASAKAGVITLTRAMAAEGSLSASGAAVRANVIVPGYIDTEMLDEFSDSFRAEAQRSIPLKRFGTAEEVADAAVFLAANQYANNCVLNLDGGLSAM